MATTVTPALSPAARNTENLNDLRNLVQRVVVYAILIGVALIMVMPFVFTIVNSFKPLPEISQYPMVLYPVNGQWTLANYDRTLNNPTIDVQFGTWILNSLFVAIITTVGHLIFDSMAGYALARIKFPGRKVAFGVMVGTMMVPGIVTIIPRYFVFKSLGMAETYSALLIPALADAFGIFLMKQFFESLPIDIEEAAMIDGCDRLRMFFIVIMPLAVPALTALAIFGFQGSWNDFMGPLIAVGSGPKSIWTVQLGLALIRGNTGSALPWDILLAGAVITTLPMAIIFFVFQRYFIEGSTYTAVKG
jgi:multiple sugar transport system permease protein